MLSPDNEKEESNFDASTTTSQVRSLPRRNRPGMFSGHSRRHASGPISFPMTSQHQSDSGVSAAGEGSSSSRRSRGTTTGRPANMGYKRSSRDELICHSENNHESYSSSSSSSSSTLEEFCAGHSVANMDGCCSAVLSNHFYDKLEKESQSPSWGPHNDTSLPLSLDFIEEQSPNGLPQSVAVVSSASHEQRYRSMYGQEAFQLVLFLLFCRITFLWNRVPPNKRRDQVLSVANETTPCCAKDENHPPLLNPESPPVLVPEVEPIVHKKEENKLPTNDVNTGDTSSSKIPKSISIDPSESTIPFFKDTEQPKQGKRKVQKTRSLVQAVAARILSKSSRDGKKKHHSKVDPRQFSPSGEGDSASTSSATSIQKILRGAKNVMRRPVHPSKLPENDVSLSDDVVSSDLSLQKRRNGWGMRPIGNTIKKFGGSANGITTSEASSGNRRGRIPHLDLPVSLRRGSTNNMSLPSTAVLASLQEDEDGSGGDDSPHQVHQQKDAKPTKKKKLSSKKQTPWFVTPQGPSNYEKEESRGMQMVFFDTIKVQDKK
jgi:hypothetical protein